MSEQLKCPRCDGAVVPTEAIYGNVEICCNRCGSQDGMIVYNPRIVHIAHPNRATAQRMARAAWLAMGDEK